MHTRERSSPSLRSVPIASPLIPPCPWPLILVSETRGSRSFHPVCPLPPPLTCLSRPFHPLWRCDGVACTQGRFGLTRRRSADGGRRPDVGDTTRERLASTLVPCAQKKPGSPTILPLGRPPSRFLGGFLSKSFIAPCRLAGLTIVHPDPRGNFKTRCKIQIRRTCGAVIEFITGSPAER